MMDFRNNMQKCQEYIHALEDEKKKIQVFQRELPLCLELVTQAIEACKQQLCGNGTTTTTECLNGHSECSEQTTSDGPILEEFMPLKRSNSTDDDEDELESEKPQINNINVNNNNNNNEKSGKKSDWLRSVQLWNQTPDPPTTQEDHQPKKVVVVEVKRNGGGGAFQPFQKEKNINGKENNDNNISNNNKQQPASTPAASACSSAQEAEMGPSSGGSGGSGGGSKREKDAQSQRKARRCWSPELHRRFVHALQQLGGSHVATPKQIRDLMKVDGLTNDEVKSHLQKYRLHTRRPSSGVHNNANQQTPQFVVVGGIWVPPEYAATTAGDTNTVTAPGSIYAPIATVATPPHLRQTSPHMQHQKQSSQSHCEERGSHSEGGVHSNSPATSSSTHTTTASHAH